VRQIFPVEGQELDVVPKATAGPLPGSVAALAALYGNGLREADAARPWLRANMIASTDGASALAGRSGGLGGPADRMVFTVLRSLADVILVGAGTARAEHYRPVTPSLVWEGLRDGKAAVPPIAVVTSSLDLSACPVLLTGTSAGAQTIVVTTAAATKDAAAMAALDGVAQVLVAGQDRVDMSEAVSGLAALGLRQILTEGGPHLLAQLAGAGLVDELCLTTSPVLAAGQASRIAVSAASDPDSDGSGPALSLELAHVLTDAGFLLSRYVRTAH
jgi:riboflavin biosynthesis pyrimidine reductase